MSLGRPPGAGFVSCLSHIPSKSGQSSGHSTPCLFLHSVLFSTRRNLRKPDIQTAGGESFMGCFHKQAIRPRSASFMGLISQPRHMGRFWPHSRVDRRHSWGSVFAELVSFMGFVFTTAHSTSFSRHSWGSFRKPAFGQ